MSAIISVESEAFKLKIDGKEPSLHNFRPQSRSVELNVCRNSFAAFQIVIHCDYRTCINLGDAPWFSEYSDATILTVRHDGLLKPILNHIGLHRGDDESFYADVLNSDPVVDVKANIPAGIFVRFEIPSDLMPGKYSGCFKIFSNRLFDNEELVDRIKYTINVRDVVIPPSNQHSFSLDLWQHNCNIARKAGVPNWSDRHFEIIEKYLQTLAVLGQRSITAIVTEIPWSGQRCFQNKDTPSNLFEYSMISVYRNPDRTFSYDYSVMDRYIELCFSYGIDKEIEVFGLINNWISVNDGFYNFTEMPEAIRIRYRMPDGSFRYMKKASDIERYIKALHQHFLEKGWLDKVRIVADEPKDHANLHKSLAMIRRVAPGFKYKASFGRISFYEEFKDEIDDFCVIITGLTMVSDEWKSIVKQDRNHEFTYYVCCFPEYPNTYLSSNLLETRYLMILADYFGLAGFLRWNYTVWPSNPRSDIRYTSFPAGDTNFVYPGGDMQPLLSLRYMTLRRGIEDCELMNMLRKDGKEEVAEEAHRMIVTNRLFSKFYDDDKTHFSFEEMSSAKHKDYEKMRIMMYNALT